MLKVKDRHAWSLAKAASLSQMYFPNAIHPTKVIKVLKRAGVGFVLIGGYGISGWLKQPRATADVDLVVSMRDIRKSISLLLRNFPDLLSEETPVAVHLRHRDGDEQSIDVKMPVYPLLKATFKDATRVYNRTLKYRVPSVEMALTMKFAGFVNPLSDLARRYYDAGDFIAMIHTNTELDEQRLLELGEIVYRGGGKCLLEMIRNVRAGEKLVL